MPPPPRPFLSFYQFLIVDNYVSSFMQFKTYEEPQKHPTRLLRFNVKDFVNLSGFSFCVFHFH